MRDILFALGFLILLVSGGAATLGLTLALALLGGALMTISTLRRPAPALAALPPDAD